MRRCEVGLAVGCTVLAVLFAGCGGDGGSSPRGTGRISLGIRFPAQDAVLPAMIPSHAESVRISVLADGRLVPDTVLNRPPGGGLVKASIPDVPAGPATIRAAAHAQPDGQGARLAEAQASVEVIAEQTTEVALTLVEVVARVVASPSSLLMLVGEQAQLTASALDPTDSVILGAVLDYASDEPSVAAVDGAGRVEAAGLGATTIWIRHAPSGKEAHVPVQVVRARVVRVEVSVDRPVTVPGQAVRFSAAAFDDLGNLRPHAEFEWRLERSAMGSIDATGRFTSARLGVARAIATERASGVEGVGRVNVAEWALLLEWLSGADLDLHVFDGVNHAYFGNPVIPIGTILADATGAPAAEGFAGQVTKAGRFPVAVNYFRGRGVATGTVTLLVPTKAPSSETFTLTAGNANGGYPITSPTASWARPLDVVVSASGDVSAATADTSIALTTAGRTLK